MGGADERPFVLDLVDAAEQKLTEAVDSDASRPGIPI